MAFTHEHSPEAFVHDIFGPVEGIAAQKARRHDEALGHPRQRVADAAQAARLSRAFKEFVDAAVARIGTLIKGTAVLQDVRAAVEGLLSRSHGVFEGPSGVAKTFMCDLMAEVLDLPFERIDGTSELNDTQVIGIEAFEGGEFRLKRGLALQPMMFLQIDEFNRVPPSAGNALLSALESRSVMVGTLRGSGRSRVNLSPAMAAVCTQNPSTYAGTNGANEALLDRVAYARRMSMPDHRELFDLCKGSRFERTPLEPVPLPATLREVWSAIEFVEIPDTLIHAIINANYFASPREYCDANGWSGCAFEANRRQQDAIRQLERDTAQHLAEGSNPRGMRLMCLRAKSNAFFRGAMTVSIADVRRAANEALLFRLKAYPGVPTATVAGVITRALDLTLPV